MEDIKKLLNFSIINIDKPSGPTSFSVTDFVRKSLGLKKASHMGTLDPKVTGVLPITLGRACRLAQYFMRHDKTYIGVLHTHQPQEIEKLQKIINENFIGKITQTPPHRSSVKRAPRERTVYFFKILEADESKKNFLFHTKVEGGTYIRKICSDLGELIRGAHMAELRRTEAGIFNESKIYTLYEFEEAVEEYKKGNPRKLKQMLLPAEEAIKKVLPTIQISNKNLKQLMTGKPLHKQDILHKTKLKKGQHFAAFVKNKFIGTYKFVGEKNIFAKPEFVYN